ncbi:MAG: hypothetical protein ACYTHJ_04810 [Planctomycetota bacterium]
MAKTANIRKLARWQRLLIWMVLTGLLVNCGTPFLAPLLASGPTSALVGTWAMIIVMTAVHLLLVVGIVVIIDAQGTHGVLIALVALLALAPCVQLLILLLVNRSVTATLKRAGLRVGFMGVNPDDLERLLNPDLCGSCGYNLTGNTSGMCPECGTPIVGP